MTDDDLETCIKTTYELTFVEWVEYKRQHLPELVDRLLDSGIDD